MHLAIVSSRSPRAAALALIASLAVLVACGSQSPSADTPVTEQDATTSSSTLPTGDAVTTDQAPPTVPSRDGGGYESAISDAVVDNPDLDALEQDITRRITTAALPGASLLVLHDGELVEQEAFGSYEFDTVVPIASASKWLAGATIMTLVEDGLIDLDEPISTYLPEATGPSGRITMRHLVSFTSGLEYDERIPCYSDLSVTLAECNAEILDLPLLGAPGSGYRYTGTHLHVAGGVAEAVTGQTWEEIFQERIGGPLGMTDTTFIPAAGLPTTAADGHPKPGGSAQATLGDYGRFLEMLVHDGVAPSGEQILTSESIAAMSTDQTGEARFISAAAHHKAAETPYGVAHWLDLTRPDGTAIVESSPGKFGFRPWIDHVNGIAGVYLIEDRDDTHVEDSPDADGGTGDVQTSGNFVLEGVAEGLGGQVPQNAGG